jgi:predicted HTH transcriptional regulator
MLSLLQLINMGEGQQLDFKYSISDAPKIARSLVAFANTDGGTLLLGVKDNGKIAGIKTDEEMYMIETAAHLYCRPEVFFNYNIHTIEGKKVMEVNVDPSMHKPHSAPNQAGKYKVYVRKNDENILANRVLLEVWRLQKQEIEISINYDELLQQVFKLFENKKRINRRDVALKLNISNYKADNLLIKLMLMHLIDIELTGEDAFYYLTEELL